jgi:hypothetical protein
MNGSGREIVSAATLDGLCCELWIDRARLLACVRGQGALHLEHVNHGAPELSPVICELWQVTHGRSVLGGFDPHRLVEQWAGAAGSWLGLGADTGRALNRLFSLGPYRECLLAVPNVSLERGGERHALVLGMITDNPIALSIDRSFGYGYRKRLGRFRFEDRRRFEVVVEREVAVSGEIVDDDEPRSLEPDRAWLDDYWAQPLLGRLGPRDFRRSWLERRSSAPEARASRVGATLVLSPALGLGVDGASGRAVSFSNVPSRISLPRRVAGG